MAVSTIQNASLASGVPSASKLPTGTVLQVVSVTDPTQYVFNSGSAGQFTYYDIATLTLPITPSFSSSKILILADICASQSNNSYNAFFRLVRGSTVIGSGTASPYNATSTSAMRTSDGGEIGTVSINYLDSPLTTSSTTYKIQICNSGGSSYPSYVNRPANAATGSWEQTGASTITLMEIAG